MNVLPINGSKDAGTSEASRVSPPASSSSELSTTNRRAIDIKEPTTDIDLADQQIEEGESPPKQVDRLSPSSAAVFDQCPRRWKFKYVDGLREPSGEAALAGSFAHQVLEELCELDSTERTIDKAKLIAKQAWDSFKHDEEFGSLDLDEAEQRAFRWKGWLAIEGLWKLEDPAKVSVVSTEQKIEATLDDVPFIGVVDRLEREPEGLVVSDYKSGKVPRARWREDKLSQVLLYAAAVKASMDEEPFEARLLYLGQQTVSVATAPDRIAEAVGALSSTWAGITSSYSDGKFEANPGVLCGWCPFVEQCPEGKSEVIQRQKSGNMPDHAPAAKLKFDDLAAAAGLD